MENEAGHIQENGAQEHTPMDHVASIKDRVQSLLECNEANFSSWVLLITEVENTSPDDMQKISLVYDSFLLEFPLCYSYWTRYAGHKVRLCPLNEVEEVYERAVEFLSHSVHLWVHYCSFAVLSFEDPADIRRLFERGLSYVAKDYFSHLLWDKYIQFEYSQKQWSRLSHIYVNTLSFPSRKLRNYYESFKKLVALLEEEMGFQMAVGKSTEAAPDCEVTDMKGCGNADISNVVDLLSRNLAGPEILKKFLSIGELLYHQSCQLDKKITCFEVHVRRRHFHVKPLDELQLENWHKYLTYVEEQGNFDWTVKIYERCLIPCANYSEFWIRYVDFMDAKGGREIANDALKRASKVFLKRIPAFHQYYSMFKEKIGDTVTAHVPFLQNGEDSTINVIENVSRRANMEKRAGNIEAAQAIYDKAIKMAHEKQNLKLFSLLYISFARFTFVVTGSVDATKEIFIKGIQQSPSKSIIEGFLDFMTMHGGKDHIASVDCKVASLICPGSEISQAISSHDREEISQLYLKFVDLFGNIHDIRKAWDRHWKLFPHIMRPSTLCDYSSNEFRVQSKKSEEPKGMLTNLPNQSNENHSKTALVKQLVEIPALMSNSMSPSKEVAKCEQKPYGKEYNEKERQESRAAEAIHVQRPIPEGSELDIANKIFSESQNLARIPHASSEYHDIEIPEHSCMKEESHGDLQPPALDNLSIANTLTCCDNSSPQEVTSKKVGNKPEDECDASSIHSSYEKNLNCELDSQEKLQEESSLPFVASHATMTVTKTARHPKFQEKMNTNQSLPVKTKHPQTASGGQFAQVYRGVQDIADTNHVLHGYMQNSRPQQWQARTDMQNQLGGTNLQVSSTQGHVSQIPWMNPRDPHGYHTQLQNQQAASQAYTNPNLSFPGQHTQQPATVYTQDQLQQASSQTQTQVYQSVSQSDGQYGYYQNMQGFSPDVWQYYQNFYYLQQQQMQQQHDQQVNFNSHRQQWTDPSQASSSQQEVLENQEEKSQMQIHSDTLKPNNLDDKLNAPNQQNNQKDKPEESTQPNQQSAQAMNFEQSQLLYLQQQQQFYLQQQHQHLMYLQQQHLVQQQQHQQQHQQHQQQQYQQQQQQQQQQQYQQQQQHQKLLIFQQQQFLQLQHQQQMSVPSSQQEQLQCLQQQQQIPLQQHHLMQQPTEAAELKSVENSHYPQGKGDPVQSIGQSANSSSC